MRWPWPWRVWQQTVGDHLDPVRRRVKLAALHQAAPQPTVRLRVTGPPFEARESPRNRGYRSMARPSGEVLRLRWTEVAPELLDEECAWLRNLYLSHGRRLDRVRLVCEDVTASNRWRAP